MKVKFQKGDPRAGQTVDVDPGLAKRFVEEGRAVAVRGEEVADVETSVLTTKTVARKAAKPAASKVAAKKAPAKAARKGGAK